VKKTVSSKEARHLQRALRHAYASLRRKWTPELLARLVREQLPNNSNNQQLLALLNVQVHDPMDVEGEKPKSAVVPPTEVEPEVECFVAVLVLTWLVDKRRIDDARVLSERLVEQIALWNRRTLDPLSAKVYFYLSRTYELANRLADVRVKLMQLLRTATLRHNYDGQVMLLNLLLRNFLQYNLFDQAEKLVQKSEFKQEHATSNEAARYHYYLGRIYAIQLRYSDAFVNLQLAIRKGPRSGAKGFRSSAIKFSSIVQLLLGEIPERSLFRADGIRKSLIPYLHLTKAVRSGSVAEYESVCNQYAAEFKKDRTVALVQRLRHNVIKAGLRKINSAYSRISFTDICSKLHLENEQDAEFIVAKAIHDGIIDGVIDADGRTLQSKSNTDIYVTNEPERAFHRRIDMMLKIHNDAVTSMRYPNKKMLNKNKEEDKDKIEIDLEDEVADLLDDDDDGDF